MHPTHSALANHYAPAVQPADIPIELHTDSPGDSTNAIARHVSITKIICFSAQIFKN